MREILRGNERSEVIWIAHNGKFNNAKCNKERILSKVALELPCSVASFLEVYWILCQLEHGGASLSCVFF